MMTPPVTAPITLLFLLLAPSTALVRSCTPAPPPAPVSTTLGVSVIGLPTDVAPTQTFETRSAAE
jgi:hypothetical protein